MYQPEAVRNLGKDVAGSGDNIPLLCDAAGRQIVALARPSQQAGRTHIDKVLANQTASATIYTVTAGKTLYVHTIVVTAVNTSTSSEGDLRLREGAGGAERIPFLMAQAGLAAGLSSVSLSVGSFALPEPLQFAAGTAVRMDIVAGTIRYSVGIVGYEE